MMLGKPCVLKMNPLIEANPASALMVEAYHSLSCNRLQLQGTTSAAGTDAG